METSQQQPQEPDKQPTLITCSANGGFASFMSQAGGSLFVTTYQAGKIAAIGWDGKQVGVLMRDFPKPMGLAVERSRMALAGRDAVYLFGEAPLLAPDFDEKQKGRYDALYIPRVTYHVNELHIHDIAWGTQGLWMVNSRFSCLCSLSETHNFVMRWTPKFITQLSPEDRCHLNGLAMDGGKPKYVTALGEYDKAGGWRENKPAGGIVIDVERNEIILRGLAMPHSPRWHDGKLWVLNSGAGEIWRVDPANGKHDVVAALPGYLRGLCFIGPFVVTGLCQIREKHIFGGLPVQQKHEKLLCALAVVDTRSGQTVGMFEFTAGCQELYDVQFLSGISRAMILNSQNEASKLAISAPRFAYWLKPGEEKKNHPPAAGPTAQPSA